MSKLFSTFIAGALASGLILENDSPYGNGGYYCPSKTPSIPKTKKIRINRAKAKAASKQRRKRR